MTLKKSLKELLKVVLDEAANNPEFNRKLEAALGIDGKKEPKSNQRNLHRNNRRAPALFDPVALARENEQHLRDQLSRLNIEQLKDIIAEYGMDSAKLAMKWRSQERIINRIVEVSLARATKGDAFL